MQKRKGEPSRAPRSFHAPVQPVSVYVQTEPEEAVLPNGWIVQ